MEGNHGPREGDLPLAHRSLPGGLRAGPGDQHALGYCSPNVPKLFFEHPLESVGLGLSLLYQPGLLDLLPMYCGFVLLLPTVIRNGGHVAVTVAEGNGDLDIRIADDGPGIEFSIRDKLFQPFVSHGKENGTGLGLTIAQKIVQDHQGSLELESSAPGRTVMRIVLPRVCRKTVIGHGVPADAPQPFSS